MTDYWWIMWSIGMVCSASGFGLGLFALCILWSRAPISIIRVWVASVCVGSVGIALGIAGLLVKLRG